MTWINYGAGDEKRAIESILHKEQTTNDNRTGIWSKCYSTSNIMLGRTTRYNELES